MAQGYSASLVAIKVHSGPTCEGNETGYYELTARTPFYNPANPPAPRNPFCEHDDSWPTSAEVVSGVTPQQALDFLWPPGKEIPKTISVTRIKHIKYVLHSSLSAPID